MKSIFKRGIVSLLSAALVLAMMTGCTNNKPDASAGNNNTTNVNGSIDRQSYIGLIGQEFGFNNPLAESDFFDDVNSGNEYYDSIQACAEWEIIPNSGSFKPKEEASLGFAIETAVRSIGLEYIDAGSTTEEMAQFFANNIAKIDISDLNASVDYEAADLIISYAKEYRNNIELPQICEIRTNEGVKESSASDFQFNEFGSSGLFMSGAEGNYSVGDIVYIQPTDDSVARGIKITSIEGNKFEYADASEEEIFYDVRISGTYEGTIVDIEYPTSSSSFDETAAIPDAHTYFVDCIPMDQLGTGNLIYNPGTTDVFIQNTDSGSQNPKAKITSDVGKDHVNFKISWKEAGVPIEATVGVKNIKVSADYDHPWYNPLDVRKANAKVSFDTDIKCEAKASVSRSFDLGSVTVNCGSTPFNVKFSLTANVGADGEISVTYKSHVVASANYAKGKGLSTDISAKDKALEIHAQVVLTAEVTAMADLRLLGYSLANIEATTGIVGIVTFDNDILNDAEPACLDLYIYVPLRWGVNQKSCLLTKISSKLKYQQVVWDSKNSKINKRWHFEDLVEVPECTRGKDKKVETPVVDEKTGEAYDEYSIFDFQPLEFDMIKLKSYSVFLDANQSQLIDFENIPEGYSVGDLIYAIQDQEVCSIDSNGNITAKNGGSTMVLISTKDGLYKIALKVSVSIDYNQNIEGGFQEL